MADPVGTDAAGRPGAPPTAGGAVSGAVDTSVEGGTSAEASAEGQAPSLSTTYHAVDSRVTAAGLSGDAFSGGNRVWGVLSLNYVGNDRDGWSWRLQSGGLYRRYQIDGPGRDVFLIDRGSVALRYMDAAELEAGALWMFGLFPASRLVGGRFAIDLPYTQVEAFAGKSIATVWEMDGPRQEFGVGQAGAVLRNFSRWFGHQIGYRRDGLADGEETAQYVADRVSFDPGTHRVHIGNSTLYEIDSGAFEVKPGVTVEILPAWSLNAAYSYTNLPPFYASIEELQNYIAHRAELTSRIRVSEGATLVVGGQAGNRDGGAMVALYSPYAGGQLFCRTAIDDREDWTAGGSLFGRVPMGSRAAFEPSAALFYKDDELSGRQGVVFDGGGRFVVTPADWFEMLLSASYTHGLVATDLDAVQVVATFSVPLGGSPDSDRPAITPAAISYGALYNEPSHRPVHSPRVWGPVMAEVAPEFSHKTFFGDDSHGEFATCGTCHAPSGSFKTEVLARTKEPCSECHEEPVADEKGLARLAAFDHVGDIRGRECGSCHIDMREMTKPTGGYGAIIKYIHEGEAVNGRRGWVGHGSRQDATCTTCHSGTAQFENHTVVTCNECHSTTANRGAVAVQGHQEWWKRSGLHGEEYKADSTSCTTCHDVAGGECMSCHQGTTGWGPTPAIARGLHNGNDGFIRFGADHGPRHGRLARDSAGAACITCHTEKPSPGNPLPACTSCHN